LSWDLKLLEEAVLYSYLLLLHSSTQKLLLVGRGLAHCTARGKRCCLGSMEPICCRASAGQFSCETITEVTGPYSWCSRLLSMPSNTLAFLSLQIVQHTRIYCQGTRNAPPSPEQKCAGWFHRVYQTIPALPCQFPSSPGESLEAMTSCLPPSKPDVPPGTPRIDGSPFQDYADREGKNNRSSIL
jgi:hypothetical protein